jgi:pimeloyl-ACP methyl ester carboxylesterase
VLFDPAALLLAMSGCVPHYGAVPPMAPAELWSPLPRQTAVVDGVPIAWVDSGGSGPPLVLIHGLSSYTSFWEYQIPAFSGEYRVIALDLPGFGASGRPDAPYTPPWFAGVVASWMDTIGVPSATIVGHSMGGQIALTMAVEHPERVSGLILSAPAGFERFTAGEAAFLEQFWTEDRAARAREDEIRLQFVAAAFNRRDDGVERLIEERVRLGKHPEFQGTSVAVARAIAGMARHPVLDRLGEITAPTLVVFGTDDRMIPNPILHGGRTRTVAEHGVAQIPGAKLVMLPGAGHTAHHDDPEGFNQAALAFLASTVRR